MTHPLVPIPSDPTPTWEMLAGRLALSIENLQRIAAKGPHLDGADRIAVAQILNAHGTPLIRSLLLIPTLARSGPDAA